MSFQVCYYLRVPYALPVRFVRSSGRAYKHAGTRVSVRLLQSNMCACNARRVDDCFNSYLLYFFPYNAVVYVSKEPGSVVANLELSEPAMGTMRASGGNLNALPANVMSIATVQDGELYTR